MIWLQEWGSTPSASNPFSRVRLFKFLLELRTTLVSVMKVMENGETRFKKY